MGEWWIAEYFGDRPDDWYSEPYFDDDQLIKELDNEVVEEEIDAEEYWHVWRGDEHLPH